MVKSMDLPCSLPANGAGDWPTTKQGGAEVAKYLMLQGVASNVGKSLLAAGLCRLFHQEGYKVAPFKAWNMALNSYMTPTGEIGRSQGIQAEAAGVLPTADMNPLLIKPTGAGESQVVVQGRVREDLKLGEPLAEAAMPIVQESLERLSESMSDHHGGAGSRLDQLAAPGCGQHGDCPYGPGSGHARCRY